MDTVLVTGISGFLGGHVALALLKKGYRVRGSVRNLSKSAAIVEALVQQGADVDHIEIVKLDLMKDDGWVEAMNGVRYLQHVASPYVISQPADKMELIRPAVEGTERALKAALATDIEHIVLTSSIIAMMAGHGDQKHLHLTAETWTNLDGPGVIAYAESKTRAEQRAWELMRDAGREKALSVVNPSGIFGPLLDDDPSTSGDLLRRLLRGSVPAAIDLDFPAVDVRDVAAVQIAAMTAPEAAGQRIPTSAKSLTFLQVAQAIGNALPSYRSKLPKFTMPNWAARLYALIDSDARAIANELGKKYDIDTSLARRLLDRDFISSEQAIGDMAKSIVERGLDK